MIRRIARQYRHFYLRQYASGKLRGDPVYAAAFELLRDNPLPVLDVGCGIGLLAFYLREQGFAPPLVGMDFDRWKIAKAREVAEKHYAGVTFRVGDALATNDFRGNVIILDVLHYVDAARQAQILESAAARVAPGGLCVVRETLRDDSWRFRVTQFEELTLRATFWMKSGAVHYPTAAEVSAPFLSRGFSADVRPLWGRTPFNSYLFTFRAPPAVEQCPGGRQQENRDGDGDQ